MKIVIKTAIPNWIQAHRWGDLYFAIGMRKALLAGKHEVVIESRADWLSGQDRNADLVIHLIGVQSDRCRRGPRHVAWVISHPESMTPSRRKGFDRIFVASTSLHEAWKTRAKTPVSYLPQATDTEHFSPSASPFERKWVLEQSPSILFVGNSRGFLRPILRDLDLEVYPVDVYGAGWEEFIPQSRIKGRFCPHEILPQVYGRASVTLNDHWASMVEAGIINNRVFDVLACGGVVVSDYHPAIESVFGHLVPMYRKPEDLASLLDQLLGDPPWCLELGRKGRALVRAHHDFSHRVQELLEDKSPSRSPERSSADPP